MLRPVGEGEDATLLGFTSDGDIELPEDFEWHDFTVFLLHVASEVEHALMVQYLYAAYSLGGDALNDQQREDARVFREIILGIAKEEMAHLITVQNILRAIGGPLHLEREDYPYRSEFYPFQFQLEPLTKTSLAKYVYAESPEQWAGVEAQEIKGRAEAGSTQPLNRVGQLYTALIKVFQAPDRIREFLPRTQRFQASWDEWGRGYREGQRGNQSGQNPDKTPDLLIETVTTREQAVAALQNIARQGEATNTTGNQQSHFTRFIQIYRRLDDATPLSRELPVNPTTNTVDHAGRTVVSNTATARWCRLFDLRYRMLLYRLKHAFFARAGTDTSVPNERGNLIAWVFGGDGTPPPHRRWYHRRQFSRSQRSQAGAGSSVRDVVHALAAATANGTTAGASRPHRAPAQQRNPSGTAATCRATSDCARR